MFKYLFARKDRLVIDNGKVFCPVRNQDTDIDLCAGCPRVRQIKDSGAEPYVCCRVEQNLLGSAFNG